MYTQILLHKRGFKKGCIYFTDIVSSCMVEERLQWISHSPCKPGVAGSITGFSKTEKKNQPPNRLSLRVFQGQRDNKQPHSTGLAQRKKAWSQLHVGLPYIVKNDVKANTHKPKSLDVGLRGILLCSIYCFTSLSTANVMT